MLANWFAGVKSPEEKEKRQLSVESGAAALDILAKICYNSISDAEKVSLIDYDSPSWSHKQADHNGYVRAMREIIKLCEINK